MSAQSDGPRKGSLTIDVLIPAIDKDIATLPLVIDSLRHHVQHRIGTIYIVSPQSTGIRRLCTSKSCTFVDEKTVLPITKNHIRYGTARWDRSGWLYQQLLKMNGDKISKAPFFLVVDADTILIRPHAFRKDGKTIFYYRSWSQPEYFRTYRKLMGVKAPSPKSFVTHYMLFEKARLTRLKQVIEARHGKAWYNAIIQSIDRKKQFGFSEYETYANYLYSKQPSRMILRKSLNKALHSRASSLSQKQLDTFAKSHRSLSFHQRKVYQIVKKKQYSAK
ncbi:hypothetical protein HPL003_22785 [Paenibacillus terrae HPL-003]|uniref:Glycosyl transferase family 2 n=1 Tax=Paenibacillus terrae (strain HPL-003) TaxID=985665 RepID=G7VR22_PAETH|nr:DUF6492 family protein [Paenibacillus terrae]AET61281.1 hypothetical protein HPL003_22785 [Paenibacillus terrae HPL-003]